MMQNCAINSFQTYLIKNTSELMDWLIDSKLVKKIGRMFVNFQSRLKATDKCHAQPKYQCNTCAHVLSWQPVNKFKNPNHY